MKSDQTPAEAREACENRRSRGAAIRHKHKTKGDATQQTHPGVAASTSEHDENPVWEMIWQKTRKEIKDSRRNRAEEVIEKTIQE